MEMIMKKKIYAVAILATVLAQPAYGYQENDGTGSNGNNGWRNSGFCSENFVLPFGFLFKPCLFFG